MNLLSRFWRVNLATITMTALCAGAVSATASAAPLTVPFDFSRNAIGLSVAVKGTPMYMLLDTGVDPSVIDLQRASSLGLPIDHANGGEGTGEGSGTAKVYPATIAGLGIGDHAFGDVEALAADLQGLSKLYGKAIDGVLGYSFLKDRIVLIDYPAKTLTVFGAADEVPDFARLCQKQYRTALRSFGDEQIPVIPDFEIGDIKLPVTLDTGSNRGIAFYQAALEVDRLRAALSVTGQAQGAGARGGFTSDTATLNAAVRLGPFVLPPGLEVAVMRSPGSAASRMANVGNTTWAALKARLLLDYPAKQVAFYGDCGR